jgi:ABC-type transport system involved in multi-copper enzyme maturation permease subunit
MELGYTEIILIALTVLILFGVGNYGRDTRLGYTGSVLLACLVTPLVAYIILAYMKRSEAEKRKELW